MRETWTFHSAGQLLFGQDAVRQLGEVAGRLGARRLFLVTDERLLSSGMVERVRVPLNESGVILEVFSGGEPEPSVRVAEQAIAAAKEFGPEAVLGLGGGSNMDLAKITATVMSRGGKPLDYAGDDRVGGPILPLICVPTTAGTGSEVSAAAVLTDTDNHIKVGILSNYLRPRVAVVDPLMTLSCPPKVTADSGIDALTHAIEAYTAVDNAVFPLPPGERSVYQGRHPMGDMLAEKAIALIGRHLRLAVALGSNVAAREGMALGATLAGMAFSNVGVALVHAMEYPVGGATHCSHGAGNGLLLPHVMRFNMPARTREFARIAQLLGEDVSGLRVEDAAEKAISAVVQLQLDIGIAQRLRDLGATRDQLKPFAAKAVEIRRILRVNPRSVTAQEVEAIYEAAW